MMEYLLYVDPGTGSYLVQVIIAGLLGIVFFFKQIGQFIKNIWWYIKSLFMRSPKK